MNREYDDDSFDTKPNIWVIAISLFLAIALVFFPWPQWFLRLNPSFPLLMLLYWSIHQPRLVNYAVAIIIGVVMDLAGQSPIGFNALVFTMLVFAANILRGRFALFGYLGQSLHILILLGAGQLLTVSLSLLDGRTLPQINPHFFIPSMTGAALWAILPFIIYRLRFRLHH